jgi:hypothetical protein
MKNVVYVFAALLIIVSTFTQFFNNQKSKNEEKKTVFVKTIKAEKNASFSNASSTFQIGNQEMSHFKGGLRNGNLCFASGFMTAAGVANPLTYYIGLGMGLYYCN